MHPRTRRSCRGTRALAAVLFCAIAMPAAAQDEAKKPERKKIYDEKADGAKQVEAALAAAKAENRRVLIQWGANWCGWCHLLHDTCEKDRELKKKLLYEYDVVLIDIGRFDKHLDLAKRYEADFKSNGVPYLTILDADGRVIANQETGSLETKVAPGAEKPESSHDVQKVLEFLTKHQATYLPAESVLEDGLARARRENKVVLLHFGAPWCGWCKRFEKWMALPEVAPVLAKDYVEVKIDTDRTIGGNELKGRYTGRRSSGIPFFVFLKPDGTVAADSFDENGNNLGCPWSPEEIAAFKKLLAEIGTNMSQADIDAITSHLGAKKKAAADAR